MAQLFSNLAETTLASGITAIATSMSVAASDGALFNAPTGGDFELITLFDGTDVASSTNVEIVKCTARTTDTLTIVRAQEGTTGFAFSSADGVVATLTSGTASDLSQGKAGLFQDVTEKVHTATTVAIDPANGNIQVRTLTGNETLTFSNVAAGQSVVLKVVPGANTLTLTNIAKWTDNGSAPSTIAAEHWLVVTNIDGTIVGSDVGGIS
jgi:hypothetical protein